MKIIIKENPFPYKVEKLLLKYFIIPGNYGKIDKKNMTKIMYILEKYKKEYKYIISKAIIYSMRNKYMVDRETKNHFKLKKYKKEVIKDFLKSKSYNSIINISKKYDISPIKILKEIMKFQNIPKENINIILYYVDTEKYSKLKKLYPFINNKAIYAIKDILLADTVNPINQAKVKEHADGFENKLKYLIDNKLNIKYKTEEELAEEQTKKFGRAIATPDFLIHSELIINGVNINWIDAKNYYGADANFVINNIKKQGKKYIKLFGPGAIVFNLGYSSKLSQSINDKNILLLSFMDLEKIKK